MLEDEEQNRDTDGKTEVEQGSRETVDTFDSGLYYKVAISSWERCYTSGL